MQSLSLSDLDNLAMEKKDLERRPSALAEVILSPGTLRVNVQGAFIADNEPRWLDGTHHDTRDIRLPNHKTLVSHVALDVRMPGQKVRAPV